MHPGPQAQHPKRGWRGGGRAGLLRRGPATATDMASRQAPSNAMYQMHVMLNISGRELARNGLALAHKLTGHQAVGYQQQALPLPACRCSSFRTASVPTQPLACTCLGHADVPTCCGRRPRPSSVQGASACVFSSGVNCRHAGGSSCPPRRVTPHSHLSPHAACPHRTVSATSSTLRPLPPHPVQPGSCPLPPAAHAAPSPFAGCSSSSCCSTT